MRMSKQGTVIGEILSGATITKAYCDLYAPYETKIRGGMFVIIDDDRTNKRLLARVADIAPEHSFYRKGDAWSGARRMQVKFPEEVATRYVSCELDILAEINQNELRTPRTSPFPGSKVIWPTSQELSRLFIPDHSEALANFAGLLDYSDVPIPLLIKNIPMHIGIFGVTGSGKSFTVGALIEALSNISYGDTKLRYPMIVIDSHGDYREYGEVGSNYGVKSELYGLPGSDRKKFMWLYIDLRELDVETLSEMIISFYSGVEMPAAIQVWALKLAIGELCRNKGWSKPDNRLFTDSNIYNELLQYIDELTKRPEKRKLTYLKSLPTIHPQTADAVKRALDKFCEATKAGKPDSLLLSWRWEDFMDKLTVEGKVAIIDLSPEGAPNIDITVKQLFVGYLTYVVFKKFSELKSLGKQRFLLLIIEECQNYCPNVALYAIGSPHFAKKYLSLVATQGRKFGASLALITQRPAFVDPAILSQCNTFFIHRIAPGDLSYVLTVTGGLAETLAKKLTVLERGQLIISGVMIPTFFPLIASVTEAHRKAPHRAGTVNPAETLYNLQHK